MSATTTATRGSRNVISARTLIRTSYLPFGGFVAILLVVVAAICVGMASFGNLPEGGGVLLETHFAMRYFSLSMGIMLAPVFMPPLLIAGATRREFTVGAVAYCVGYALVLALMTIIGVWLESLFFQAQGVAHGIADDQNHMVSTTDQLPLVGLEILIVVAGHIATGWLIGAAYLRLGGWRGTYVLPLTILPMLAVDALTGTGWVPYVTDALLGWTGPPLGIGIASGVAVVVATCLLSGALVRRAPI